jgi:hypothetical protein
MRTHRLASVLVLLLALAPAAHASPAAPAPSATTLLAAAAAPASASSLDRAAIFEILCGGLTGPDPGLRAHLWQVAGSLASRRWTPPQVTVRVVVTTVGR